MTTNEELHELMRRHSLTKDKVRELLSVSIFTVGSWLKARTNKSFRRMPGRDLELLREKLEGATRL